MAHEEDVLTSSAAIIALAIGVASYGALGHVPPSTSSCLILLSLQSRTKTNSGIGLYVIVYPERM